MPERPFPWLLLATVAVFLLVDDDSHAQQPDSTSISGQSTVRVDGDCVYNVPDGSGERLELAVGGIVVQVVSTSGGPVVGLAAEDFEVDGAPLRDMSDAFFPLTGANDVIELESLADGVYRIVGPLLAGGCGEGILVRVRGVLVNSGLPVPLSFRSADLVGSAGLGADGIVNLIDVARFAELFGSGVYSRCADLNCDGAVDIGDVGLFAIAFGAEFPDGAELDVD